MGPIYIPLTYPTRLSTFIKNCSYDETGVTFREKSDTSQKAGKSMGGSFCPFGSHLWIGGAACEEGRSHTLRKGDLCHSHSSTVGVRAEYQRGL